MSDLSRRAAPRPRTVPAMAYGFVGTGELTSAIVRGLHRGTGEPPAVFLSPRGERVGRELAGRFPAVRVCRSNQEVLDHATAVVVAVRPPVGRDVLAGLSFRPEHVVISAMAGITLDRLRAWTAPAGAVVRSIPLPQAATGRSLTVLYPDQPVARALFDRVGGVLVPGTEPALEAFSATTSTFAAHLDYLTTIADWLAGQGVDPADATGYVTHIFAQLGRSLSEESLSEGTGSLAGLTGRHMTPGGINEQFLTDLRQDGMPATVRRALDRILARLRAPS